MIQDDEMESNVCVRMMIKKYCSHDFTAKKKFTTNPNLSEKFVTLFIDR